MSVELGIGLIFIIILVAPSIIDRVRDVVKEFEDQ